MHVIDMMQVRCGAPVTATTATTTEITTTTTVVSAPTCDQITDDDTRPINIQCSNNVSVVFSDFLDADHRAGCRRGD